MQRVRSKHPEPPARMNSINWFGLSSNIIIWVCGDWWNMLNNHSLFVLILNPMESINTKSKYLYSALSMQKLATSSATKGSLVGINSFRFEAMHRLRLWSLPMIAMVYFLFMIRPEGLVKWLAMAFRTQRNTKLSTMVCIEGGLPMNPYQTWCIKQHTIAITGHFIRWWIRASWANCFLMRSFLLSFSTALNSGVPIKTALSDLCSALILVFEGSFFMYCLELGWMEQKNQWHKVNWEIQSLVALLFAQLGELFSVVCIISYCFLIDQVGQALNLI